MTGRDLRLPLLAAAAWSGGLIGPELPAHAWPWWLIGGVVLSAGALAVRRLVSRRLVAGLLLALLAALALSGLRTLQIRDNPLAQLADRHAAVSLTGTVSGDPTTHVGARATDYLVAMTVTSVTGRGRTYALRAPVLAIGDQSWDRLEVGSTVHTSGVLIPTDGDLSGLLAASGAPDVVRRPGLAWRASGRVRAAIRDAAGRHGDAAGLLPALVDGDVGQTPADLVADFQTTGLTHLTAVSGTNLTILVGFLLLLARWSGVRGRWLYAVATAGIAGFVLLARAEPSVLRAAVMGGIGLLAMGTNGRQRALRSLGAAVLALVLVDPGLARSVGFALSVLATAGILLLAPGWRDALGRWLPSWLAEAIAVPAAAQLACTPVIAAISGQVSLVAVAANLVVEPVVGPATVLGLTGGVLDLAWAPLGHLVATPGRWCVEWLVVVARHGAALPSAGIGWGTGVVALAALTALTLVIAFGGPYLARHRWLGLTSCVVLVAVMTVRLPTSGWPPKGWVFTMCDVGQGDGTALHVGPDSAITIDAGPDPVLMDRCLDGLHITTVPLALFTHFDSDHVDGASAIFDGRHVGTVWTTKLQQPPAGVAAVDDAAASAGITPQVAPWGRTLRIGTATLQVLWPRTDLPLPSGIGTATNQASVVLLVHDGGLSLLLTGDLEPDSAADIAAEVPGLHVDVLKVAHHGSKYQDFPWLAALRPKIALISVGADNTYGHPAPETVDSLLADGAAVYRTDQDGSLAVVATPHGPQVVEQ